MSEEKVTLAAPVTVMVDIDELLRSRGEHRFVDEDGEPYYQEGLALEDIVARHVAKCVEPEIKRSVAQAVKERALKKVDAVIEDVVNGEIQLTNSYGEATGKSTTLREQMVKAVSDQLQRRVTRHGNAAANYDRDAKSYIQYVSEIEAKKLIDGILKSEIESAVSEIRGSIRKLVADDLATKIAKLR